MKKNKKGVSLMLSYVILIAITVSLSIAVFAWLRVVSNISPIVACEEETSVFVADYECKNNYFALNIKNNGRFNVEGFILNVGNDPLKTSTTNLIPLEEDKISREGFYLFQPVLIPGNNIIAIFSNTEKTASGEIKQIDFEEIKNIKIQPFIIDKKSRETILCESIIKQKIDNCNIRMQNMKITSPAFQNNANIPLKYTCDGENINPVIDISGVPRNSESLVLIVDDPDAPSGTWTHWIVFNINPTTNRIEENNVPVGSVLGINDFGNIKYDGPCPPSGTHRYYFKLYALDIRLNLPEGSNKEDIENAMEGYILSQTELIGKYSKT